jgi:hypothetical protein
MTNKNYNWYNDSKINDALLKEAGFGDSFKKSLLAVALILSGASIFTACQKSGLSQEEVESALNDQKIIELARMSPTPEWSVLEMPEQAEQPEQVIEQAQPERETPHGLPTALDVSGIETLIRLHEVSGSTRMVTIGGETIDIRKVYKDPIKGWKVPTIGVGFNLNRRDAKSKIEAFGLDYNKIRSGKEMLTDEQVNQLYGQDIQNAIGDAQSFLPNFSDQPTEVKTIVSDMSFNMGLGRLSTFRNFREALMNFNFDSAAHEMRDSNWARQTGTRADRLIEMMRNIQNHENVQEQPNVQNHENIPEQPNIL